MIRRVLNYVLINDTPLNRIGQNCVDTSVKFLGICIDEHLTWKNHIQQVNCKISKAMFAIKQVTNLNLIVYYVNCTLH